MTIQQSIKVLSERLEFARKEYSSVAEDYKLALLTAIECMKKYSHRYIAGIANIGKPMLKEKQTWSSAVSMENT